MPRVTVLMPVYNGEKYIHEAIDSVVNQTFADFELLIINDGSTDRSLQIVNCYNDARIRLLKNSENLGLAATRNKGLANARGEYIAWLDCDDIAYPERLAEQVKFLDDNPDFGMIGSWVEMIDEKSHATGEVMKYIASPEEIPILLLFNNYFAQSALLIRKTALPSEGYNKKFMVAEDYDLWVRIAHRTRVWNLQKPLTRYRVHNKSISFEKSSLMEECVRTIVLNQLNLLLTPSSEELNIHRNIENQGFLISIEAIEKIDRWLQKLYHANWLEKLYPNPYFDKVLTEKWFLTYSRSTSLGWPVWHCFHKSPLSMFFHLSRLQTVKLFIKCLIKWPNNEQISEALWGR